jgi:ABC-type uncharacterized transport system substrate-binding protein
MRLARLAAPATLSLALLAAPLTVHAQQPGKVYRIGTLRTFLPAPPYPVGDAFLDGLREHGYVEGQNLTIERRFSEGKADRLPALVADLLRLDVQLIVTGALGPSRAAKDATTTVPIVFVAVADPIGMGLVASLARPAATSRVWPPSSGRRSRRSSCKSSRRPCPEPRASRSS